MLPSQQSGSHGAQSRASVENLPKTADSGRDPLLAGSGAGRMHTGEPRDDAEERRMMAEMGQKAGKGSENKAGEFAPDTSGTDTTNKGTKFSGSAVQGPDYQTVQETPKDMGAR